MLSLTPEQRVKTTVLLGEVVRFVAAGVFSYGLGIILSILFHEFIGLRQEVAVALSLAAVLATNFWVARSLIFRSIGDPSGQFIRFATTSLIMRGLEYAMFYLLLKKLNINYLVSMTIAMAISSCIKFLVYRIFVFGKPDPAAPGRPEL
jgi:putative flippase GtrA